MLAKFQKDNVEEVEEQVEQIYEEKINKEKKELVKQQEDHANYVAKLDQLIIEIETEINKMLFDKVVDELDDKTKQTEN